MFRRDQFGIVFNSFFSLAFAGAMTAFSLFMQGGLSAETFFMGLVPAFAINFVLGSYIPLLRVGNAFAGIFVKNDKSLLFHLLRMLAIVLIMTASMSFLVMFSRIGFRMELIFAFLGAFPMSMLFAYIVALLIFPLLLKITETLCDR